MSIVCIITSVISAIYYLKIIRLLHTESEKANITINTAPKGVVNTYPHAPIPYGAVGGENLILSNSHSFLISTLPLAILFFVLKPSILLNSTKLLSLSLFYY